MTFYRDFISKNFNVKGEFSMKNLKEKSPGLLFVPGACFSSASAGVSIPASASVLSSFSFSTLHSNTSFSDCQIDFSSSFSDCLELEQKFQPKKLSSQILAQSFSRLGKSKKKVARVLDCGSLLEFRHAEIVPGVGLFEKQGELHNANFCRERLCPMCAWRRSYKIFAQCSQIMDLIVNDYEFVFLTLTIPSVAASGLSIAIDKLMKGFSILMKKTRLKKAVCGFYRALEVTRNNNFFSKSYGLYHPHFHIVFAVRKSYFTSRDYISQSEFLQMWRDSFGDQSITQVDVRRTFGNDISASVAEVAKYTVKSSDYLFPDNPVLTDEIVGTLSSALAGRRLVSFGGCFRKAWHQLNLDDPEDGDLVNLDGKINSQLRYLITLFGWSAGVYKLTDAYYFENGQPIFDKN